MNGIFDLFTPLGWWRLGGRDDAAGMAQGEAEERCPFRTRPSLVR